MLVRFRRVAPLRENGGVAQSLPALVQPSVLRWARATIGLSPLPAHAVTAPPNASGTQYDHLNLWTAALEEAGILVLTTHGGGVLPTEMRAFSLYYDLLPVIMVNGSDAPRGRLFSLLHEYAHLLRRTAGLCDMV